MEERFIASIDLGTSKISVSVAKISGANVQVVYYKESPSQGIRYSYVYNPKMVENRLKAAISEAQQELRIKIRKVIIGLPRYYVRQESGSASVKRENGESQIEEKEIKDLKNEALQSYPIEDQNEIIYGAVAQSFSTEEEFNELESDIIGMTASKLEGNFKVFIGSKRHSNNIGSAFKGMDISIAKKYFTPGLTARAVLKDEQMENGVALIDIGAGVSSVTIFKGKIMRFYSAIPFGGNSITNDIKSECNISFQLAENIKKAYGACLPGKLSSFGDKILQINGEDGEPDKKIPVKYLSEIITARMKEIIEALLYEIERSRYSTEDQLRAGVVITGGGSELVNCANLFKEMSGYSVRTGSPRPFFSCDGCEGAKSTGAAVSMGMLLSAKGDINLNCAGGTVWSDPGTKETKPATVPTKTGNSKGGEYADTQTPQPGNCSSGNSNPAGEGLPEEKPAGKPQVEGGDIRQPAPEEDPGNYRPYPTGPGGGKEGCAFPSGKAENDVPEEKKPRNDDEKVKKKEKRPSRIFTWIKSTADGAKKSFLEHYDNMDKEEV